MGHGSPDIHLATEHLRAELKTHTVSGGLVTGVQQAAMLVISLTSVIVLARLLSPEDFGLLAMVFAVMGFFRAFSDAGLSTATIQREKITHAQVSNLFWTNTALGGAIAIALAFCAPAFAWFYKEPRVTAVTVALSVTFILTGLTVQHLALMRRQMRFRAIAAIQIAAAVAGVGVGTWMAWWGYGYWSLVGMQLVTPACSLFMSWLLCRWRPQMPARHSGTRPLLRFGASLTASDFLWSLARNSDGLLIGRWFGPEQLGVYSRATALLNRPLEQAVGPLGAVFLPALSRVQLQPERYRRVVLEVHELVAVFSLLGSAVVLTLAKPVTIVVLGQRWEAASAVLAAYSLYAMYVPMTLAAAWVLSSQGRGRDLLLLSCFTSTITISAFAIGLRFGLVGVAMSYSISCLLIQLPIVYWITGRVGVVTARDLWNGVLRHLPLWVIVAISTWFTRISVAALAPAMQLLICIPVALLSGTAAVWFSPPSHRAARVLVEIVRTWARGGAATRVER